MKNLFAEKLNPLIPRPIAPEAIGRLELYASLLGEWQNRMNLVAKSTLPDMWNRHFLDSAQLAKYIPGQSATIMDIGSGAGFPGLVLAIIGGWKVSLVERAKWKCEFLREVISKTGAPATVYNQRIEALEHSKVDFITARALAKLDELIECSERFIKPEGCLLFLKGERSDAEIADAKKRFMFECETFQSITDPTGRILKISRISPLQQKKNKRT